MFKDILQYYLSTFNQKGEEAIKIVCNCVVPVKIISTHYKTLSPMLNDEYESLVEYGKELFPDEPDKWHNVAIVTYTIGNLL
jgi:hypothetical protein